MTDLHVEFELTAAPSLSDLISSTLLFGFNLIFGTQRQVFVKFLKQNKYLTLKIFMLTDFYFDLNHYII